MPLIARRNAATTIMESSEQNATHRRVHCGGTERVFQYPAPTTSMCPSMYESGRSHDSYRTKMRVPSRLTSSHRPCMYPSLANKSKMLGISYSAQSGHHIACQ